MQIANPIQSDSENSELREKMLAEDSAISEFQEIEMELENERKLRGEAEKQKELVEKQKELVEKQLEHSQKQIVELQNKLLEIAKNMILQGNDIASVAQILGISEEDIQKIL